MPFTAAVWEPSSASRTGTLFNGNSRRRRRQQTSTCSTSATCTASGPNNWDLTLRKNIRFAGKRLNFGVDIYNLFNSDAATGYNQTYTAILSLNGAWVTDNPATPAVEVNEWGNITQLVNPRFMRFTLSLDF